MQLASPPPPATHAIYSCFCRLKGFFQVWGCFVRFVMCYVLTVRSCWPLAHPPVWTTTPCPLSATVYAVYAYPYLEAVFSIRSVVELRLEKEQATGSWHYEGHGWPTFVSQRATTVTVNWLAGRTCKNHSIWYAYPSKLINYTYYGVLLQKCNIIIFRWLP
jgi:hypothetical protein